jgi:hypothetical protein
MLGLETGAVPSFVEPSKNVTVPLGVPAPGAVTEIVAVRTTGCPYVDGFRLEVTEVVVDALFTFWVTAGEVLLALSVSPV